MRLERRRHNSQRPLSPVELEFHPNWSGQGGEPYITFKGVDNIWYFLHFESIDEAKAMLSQAHIAYGNVCDKIAMDELKAQHGIRRDQ